MCIFAGTYMWSIANWSNWLKSTREWWSMGSLPFTARMPPSSYQMFTTSRQQIFDIKHTYSTIHKITDTVTKHIHTHTDTDNDTEIHTRRARASNAQNKFDRGYCRNDICIYVRKFMCRLSVVFWIAIFFLLSFNLSFSAVGYLPLCRRPLHLCFTPTIISNFTLHILP